MDVTRGCLGSLQGEVGSRRLELIFRNSNEPPDDEHRERKIVSHGRVLLLTIRYYGRAGRTHRVIEVSLLFRDSSLLSFILSLSLSLSLALSPRRLVFRS